MSFVAGLSGTVDFEDGQKGKSTTSGRILQSGKYEGNKLFYRPCRKLNLGGRERGNKGTHPLLLNSTS